MLILEKVYITFSHANIMSKFENKIIKIFKSNFSSRKTLYVLKGFNYWSRKIMCDKNCLLHDGYIITESNYDLSTIGDKFSNNDPLFCLYEDLVWINEKSLGGIFAVHGYRIIIIENDLFYSYYPDYPFAEQDNLEKIEKFNKNTDDIIQKYYSDVAEVSDQVFLMYNELRDTNIEIIKISKFIEDDAHIFDKNKIIELPDECNNLSFATILFKVITEDIGIINVLEEKYSDDHKLGQVLKKLNKIGIEIKYREFQLPSSKIDDILLNKYREILQRKNNKYNFKEILIYKDPYESVELAEVNQSLVIDSIVKNVELSQKNTPFKDIFMTAPTGAGKSVMFQIPAIYLAEKYRLLTIVVTPLIGLMNDQVTNIKSMTDKAATINSDYTPFEKEETLIKVKNGDVDILYLSPESLLSNSDISSLIGDRKIGLVVVDESHIVATWGKSFRPDYWYLGEYINKLRNDPKNEHRFPIATFTATATFGGNDDMYQDIIDSLKMTPIKFIGNVKRKDISFDIRHRVKNNAYREEKIQTAIESIEKLHNTEQKVLVYTPYVGQIDDIFAKLSQKNKIGKYHGRMQASEKNETLKKIKTGEINLVLATKAFGMGIDIDDIKYVYHFAPTGNVADYVQEIGRVARRPDLTGAAVTDFYKEDFRYVNRLYGMSSIKNYQVIGVLKKIFELYNKHNRRNFLVAPEMFSYLYADVSLENVDAKLKTTLLVIKKDFELSSNTNFYPLIFKPRSMFTYGYFMINDDFVEDLKTQGVMSYFQKLQYPREVEQIGSRGSVCVVRSPGDTYRLNFKQLWENKYKDLSFSQFKHSFFNNELSGFSYRIGEKIVQRTILEIESGDINFGTIRNQLIHFLDSVKGIFDELKQENKYFSTDDLSNRLKQKATFKKSYMPDMIASSIIPMLDRVDLKGFFDNHFVDNRQDKYYIRNNTYEKRIQYLKRAAYKLMNSDDSNYAIKYIESSKRNSKDIIVSQLLEILELANVKISAGSHPEFFIRVNSPYAIEKIINNKYYSSQTLKAVDQKHKDSCLLMERFFIKLKTDSERWEFVERYFLGMIESDEILENK